MSHIVDESTIPHHQLHDENAGELHIDVVNDPTGSGLITLDVRSPQVHRSVATNKTGIVTGRKRATLIGSIVTVLCLAAVAVGIVVYNSHQKEASSTNNGAATTPTSTNNGAATIPTPPVTPVTPQTDEELPFLQISFENPSMPEFVLAKSHWNESFMVYPTVVKHSQPPHSGWERGSVLLETTDYVFHFEKSKDDRFLFLVLENHLARLESEDDELRDAFQDSQWPGYVTRLAIYMETNDAYYIGADTFLAHGFFVSWSLMTPYFTPLPEGCAFYPRNSNIQVEYELNDGVVWVNYAIGLLPETLMPMRVADDRVGYFMQRFINYGVDNDIPQAATTDGLQFMDTAMTVINRRRLEIDPKTGKTKNPITYHIDPSVPKRWQDAFVAGVMAWAPAFEAIGFKNAIKAVKPGDADWPDDYRIGDLRYDSISIMISDQTYAIGPMVFDPRSGEILHSDITFEYGFFNEVIADFELRSPVSPPASASSSLNPRATINASRMQYSAPRQCGIASNPHHKLDRMVLGMLLRTELAAVPDDIIGRHFTDIVMHEVGHTLGLRHNFAGTAQVTRAQLASPAFTSKNGLSTSIMDYTPVNIFSDLTSTAAQTHGFYQTVIGSYDKAAIAYGYSTVADETPGFKSSTLTKLAQSAPMFLTDEDTDTWTNPFGQRFDISSDPIDFANDRLELVKKFRQSKLANRLADDAPWSNLWRYESTLLRMINQTIEMVQPFLGGVNATHAHRKPGETTYAVPFVSKRDQQRALTVLARIIRAEDGIFAAPEEYASFVEVMGYSDEDCVAPSNSYGCLARSLVDMDKHVQSIRENAVISAMFPVVDRILAQDALSPLTIQQVLGVIETAASIHVELPRNQLIYYFFHEVLDYIIKSDDEDSRLRLEVYRFVNSNATMS